MFSRDNRGDELFSNSTIDTSNPDKIVIREKDAPKKKVRRRVKKGTKSEVIAKRQEVKKASKVKVVKNSTPEKSIFDTTSFDFVDLNSYGKEDQNEDSSFKIPRLSDINRETKDDDFDNVDLGSDFRQSAADWRDNTIPDYSGLNELSSGGGSKMSWIQWVAIAVAAVLFVSSVLGTNVYAKQQCADNRAEAMSKLTSYEDNSFEQIAEAVEDVEAPISLEEATPQIGKVLSLVLTSVEKDLKIKLIDEDDTLVKNVPWSVTVADSDGNSSEEADDDQDGIIHMTDVSAGDYSVTLNPNDSLADFELPLAAQSVSVKAKVEYKVIANIKDEIKTEKEVNVAAEDAAGNQAADVETAPPPSKTDTVELVDSTKTVDGEEYVEATPDISKTQKAYVSSGKKLATVLEKIRDTAAAKFGNVSLAYTAILAENEPTSDGKTEQDSEVTSPEGSTENPPHSCSYTEFGSSDGSVSHTMKCACGKENTYRCDFGADGKCKQLECTNECSHLETPRYEQVGDSQHKKICSSCGKVLEENISCTNTDSDCVCGRAKKVQETSVTINPKSLTLKVGDTGNISATVTPSGTASYSSDNTGVATVDGSGKVTAIKAGTANIKATVGDKSDTCAITVTEKPVDTTITLSGTSSVKVNETTVITATINPSDKTIKTVTFGDSTIASCVIDGKQVKVTGTKAGSTSMKVITNDDKEATMTITVTSDEAKYADDAQLYDASMNALYVKDGDTYRLAKYKDYKDNPNQKFYRKQETFLYTGWQTIDGQRCYFDKDHNKVTGKQIIGGVEYDFGEGGTMSTGSGTLGIDVSKYQPSINWSQVKSSGVDYVIIRCGYRGSSTGVLIEDPYFKSHIKGAKAAGLKVGVYFFTTALTEAEAVEEASMCAYLCNGYGLDFPIFMDCESSPRPGYNGMSAGQRTAIIKAFCNTIRSAGYSAGVYANKTWLSSYINAGELSGYKIWLAQYNAAGPTYSGRYDMWQYTSKGSVNGISGYVDMNKCYYR